MSPTISQAIIQENGLSENQLRQQFESMHEGRRLEKHYLRNTYNCQQIQALWTQHVRTTALCKTIGDL